jgi:hypothetical protein
VPAKGATVGGSNSTERCRHGDGIPLRLFFHTWHEQQKAKRTDVLAERVLVEMRRRQAGARPSSRSRRNANQALRGGAGWAQLRTGRYVERPNRGEGSQLFPACTAALAPSFMPERAVIANAIEDAAGVHLTELP